MIERKIMLGNIEFVKDFVNTAMSKDYDIELLSGKYIVNGKSIMGVFSLDLTKPLTVRAHCDENDTIKEEIEKYIFTEN